LPNTDLRALRRYEEAEQFSETRRDWISPSSSVRSSAHWRAVGVRLLHIGRTRSVLGRGRRALLRVLSRLLDEPRCRRQDVGQFPGSAGQGRCVVTGLEDAFRCMSSRFLGPFRGLSRRYQVSTRHGRGTRSRDWSPPIRRGFNAGEVLEKGHGRGQLGGESGRSRSPRPIHRTARPGRRFRRTSCTNKCLRWRGRADEHLQLEVPRDSVPGVEVEVDGR